MTRGPILPYATAVLAARHGLVWGQAAVSLRLSRKRWRWVVLRWSHPRSLRRSVGQTETVDNGVKARERVEMEVGHERKTI